MVMYKQGDLFDTKADIIAHQCNCKGVMGSGVAAQVRSKYPMVFEMYRLFCNSLDEQDLIGEVQIVYCGKKKIANLFGQLTYGSDGGLYTSYDDIRKALCQLYDFAKKEGLSVALPHKIGCGLGGGNWDIVEGIITDIFNCNEVICEIWKLSEE